MKVLTAPRSVSSAGVEDICTGKKKDNSWKVSKNRRVEEQETSLVDSNSGNDVSEGGESYRRGENQEAELEVFLRPRKKFRTMTTLRTNLWTTSGTT